MTWDQLLPMLWEGTVETLYMTLWSSAIAYLIGLPLGVLLVVTRRGGIMPSVTFNAILGVAINFLRSIPFVIMIAVLFPVTRLVMGSSIGTRSVIFPLVISAFPYIARMVESSLAEVDHGIIEAAQSMAPPTGRSFSRCSCPRPCPPWLMALPSASPPFWAIRHWPAPSAAAAWVRWPSSRASISASMT